MEPRYGGPFDDRRIGKFKNMRLDRFTEKAQEALQEASELARGLGQQAIEPEHLILALIDPQEGVSRRCRPPV
jgi:ClpA/ClpB-like protein